MARAVEESRGDGFVTAAGGLGRALVLAREKAPFIVKIEVENAEDAVKAAELGADMVMLDDMGPSDVAKVHGELMRRGLRKRVVLEASGNIDEKNIADYAKYVDVISIGSLTHSYKSIDMNMDLIK
jgi:nicotinate-nucleotide pyrophosphorylase (carboxylating)